SSVSNPFGLADVGSNSAPSFVDIDGDGDLDALVGDSNGNFTFFENTADDSTVAPQFGLSSINPFGLTAVGRHSTPSFVDIDGDGDLDALVGDSYGNTIFFENTADDSTVAPQFTSSMSNPFGLVKAGFYSAPSFVDIDGDGDLDALVGGNSGNIIFFENTADNSTVAPQFASSMSNPFGLTDVGYRSTPSFVDIDGDGDLDALVGDSYGNITFFENTVDVTPVFASSMNNPFGLADVGSYSSPSFVDIDGDGDLDALVGESSGNIFFFENIATALTVAPIFASSMSNPFGLSDVGNNSAPSFIDIDGDGDLDALVGDSNGNITFFENTKSSIVVPVTLISFTVLRVDESVQLAWQTSSEQNNIGFYVERSTDGQSWTQLGFTAGAGTTEQPQTYQFIDTNPASGQNYYRLQQVDLDGQFEYSDLRLVWIDETSNGALQVYPNPGRDQLYLSGLDLQNVQSVHFYNAMGHLLQRVLVDFGRIDISDLPEGWYNVEVVLVNGQREQRSFVKQ
ncbi:MAG: T9SS type A sorting domain-containing protein, partial [Bacteroidota bacterium]